VSDSGVRDLSRRRRRLPRRGEDNYDSSRDLRSLDKVRKPKRPRDRSRSTGARARINRVGYASRRVARAIARACVQRARRNAHARQCAGINTVNGHRRTYRFRSVITPDDRPISARGTR